MTVNQLKSILSDYPECMEIVVPEYFESCQTGEFSNKPIGLTKKSLKYIDSYSYCDIFRHTGRKSKAHVDCLVLDF